MRSDFRLRNGFLGSLQIAPSHWPSGGGRAADAIELMLTGAVGIKSRRMAKFGSFGGNVNFPKSDLLGV